MAKVRLNRYELEMGVNEDGTSDSLESLLRRFKRQVRNEGIMDEVRKRKHFKNKAEKRKEKEKVALIRRKRGY